MKPMYHPGKFRARGSQRDSHGIHPVHLTLHATATPVSERPPRQTPDRQTRDQAATFRPSDLPIGHGPISRRLSAHSDLGSSHSVVSAPIRTTAIGGPPMLLHTISDTRLLNNSNNRTQSRQLVSPSKASATEFSQFSSGDTHRRSIGSTSVRDFPVSDIDSVSTSYHHTHLQHQHSSGSSSFRHPMQGNKSVLPHHHQHNHDNQQEKPTPCLPGDRVIFAESPSAPGIPIVYRTAEERASNPDRLNLDRRKLAVCPILEGEEHLRLLNYQHNQISRIQHLSNLRRLIFLDLYDNQITDMTGLSALKSLRVLMLGKNRIRNISSLENLTKLDVLDLHGNQIEGISNLKHLTELRVLNLAGNQIEKVDNLAGMDTLTELNLRRNKIRIILEIESLPSLQRLFLSYNCISRWEDISCLAESSSLSEISLDGNPITSESWYKQVVLKNMLQLKQLDSKRVTDDERRVAAVMVRKEEERKREVHKQAIAKEKKRLAINNAARQWEAEFGSTADVLSHEDTSDSSRLPSYRSGYSSGKESGGNSDKSAWLTYSDSHRGYTTQQSQYNNGNKQNNTQPHATSLDMSDSYLAEIDGDCLQLFGPGALDSLDKNWGVQTSGSVTTIIIQFINFDDFCTYIPKIRNRFPNAVNLILREVNLHSLPQLNALAQLRRLESISIECGPGNPVTQYSLWRSYLLFRLSHFELQRINNEKVTSVEALNAEKLFGTLSDVTTAELSQYRLLSILGEMRQKVVATTVSNPKPKNKIEEDKTSERQVAAESIGKVGLQCYSTKQIQAIRKKAYPRKQLAQDLVKEICDEAVIIERKHAALGKLWPSIFIEMIKESVTEMWDKEKYMKEHYEVLFETPT
ncbi:leucine-rich repeat-containing protein 49-like [Styela clava]